MHTDDGRTDALSRDYVDPANRVRSFHIYALDMQLVKLIGVGVTNIALAKLCYTSMFRLLAFGIVLPRLVHWAGASLHFLSEFSVANRWGHGI